MLKFFFALYLLLYVTW